MRWRPLTLAALAGSFCALATAGDATIVINNGDAPPNPANVIASDPADTVLVQAAGCDATVAHPCPLWGAQTTVLWNTGGSDGIEVLQDSRLILGSGADRALFAGVPICAYEEAEVVVDGAVNAWVVTGNWNGLCVPGTGPGFDGQITVESGNAQIGVDDGSVLVLGGTASVDMSTGGFSGSAHLTIEGGDVTLNVFTGNFVEIRGGTVNQGQPSLILDGAQVDIHGGDIAAPMRIGFGPLDQANVRVHGVDFEIDGSPVAYGTVTASSGELTGTLESGEPIAQDFEVSQFSVLMLVESPPQGPPAIPALGALGVWMLGLGLLGIGAQRARARGTAHPIR